MENNTPLKAGIFIALAAAILFGCAWCSEHRERVNDNDKMREAWVKDTVALVRKFNAKDSTTRWTMEAKIGQERDARILSEDDAKRYKHLYSIVTAKASIKIKDVLVPFAVHDTIKVADNAGNAEDCIPVGSTFSTSNKDYFIAGTIEATAVRIDSFGIPPVGISVTIGDDSKWWQKAHPVVVIKSENPLIVFDEGNNIVVLPKKGKAWRAIWSHLAAFGAGVVVGKVAIP
jgi:hypothetical protein